MEYTVLSGRDQLREVILDEKRNFIAAILEELGINVDTPDLTDTIGLRGLREELVKFDVYISFNGDDSVEMYFQNDLIALWKKPYYILEKDLSQVDPRKKTYFKVFFNATSIFEENDG